MSSDQEINRIQRVYQGYRNNTTVQQQWDGQNPGNQAILQERERQLQQLLVQSDRYPLAGYRILDVGCGTGRILGSLQAWGAAAKDLYGVDLIPERISAGRAIYPAVNLYCQNAENLPFDAGSFDLIIAFTLFSSILDTRMAGNIAGEMERLLKSGGGILWYDMRYNNPQNPHVRRINRKQLQKLFPRFTLQLQTITLIPPLARRLGRLTPYLYPALGAIPVLRSHYLGLFTQKEDSQDS